MCLRIFTLIIILIAVCVGVGAQLLPREQLVSLIVFQDFFTLSVPILGFGALVKYLCTCSRAKCCCGGATCGSSDKKSCQ